jgi:hypothetical protein
VLANVLNSFFIDIFAHVLTFCDLPTEGSGSSSPKLEISFNGARFCFVGRFAVEAAGTTTISSASRLAGGARKQKEHETKGKQ